MSLDKQLMFAVECSAKDKTLKKICLILLDRFFLCIFLCLNNEQNRCLDLSFTLGEQDLFITSDLTDNISFLGESVFKYSATSSTKIAFGLERAILKYIYKGNHNIQIGRFHTPMNYWNDSYHHGRVFFPTVGRPESFNEHLIPIHTVGIMATAENL